MSSLPARSGAVTWTWFRSLRTGHVSWPRFMRRCLLPSPGSLRLVPLLQRYYEALRPPDSRFAALRFLRLAIPWSVCVSSPFGRRRQADGSSRSLLYRLLPIRLTSWNCQDLPCSRETLMTIRPALRPRRDRVRATGPRVNVLDTAPAPKHNEGSPRFKFRGSITRLLVSLSTPRSGSYPPPRKTRFRLLVPALPGGIRPAGFL